MNRHAAPNRVDGRILSAVRNVWISLADNTRERGTRASRTLLAATLSLGTVYAHAGGPSGGQITAGTGSIAQSGAITTITQESSKLSLIWTNFNISPQETVDFMQPSASAIAVNRIYDINGTQILGHLNANGQVYLINPNGILFGPGAELNVGGLVATTLDFNNVSADGTNFFSGNSASAVVNEGTINTAPGGYVALLASHVSNQGVISAQLGSVALAAGSGATLTFSNNTLVRLQVDQSALRTLAENGGLIRADGGQVLLTAGARDALVASVVNNTGVIEARTVDTHDGTIILQGGMTAGTVHVGGTLDASAPDGGNGGFIETSAAHVEVEAGARVTTAAASGLYGSWLIDPLDDYTVAASGGDITGALLSTNLGTGNVILQSSQGGTSGSGNVNVDDVVSWSANTSLTLTASNNVNINANITATGNTAGLVINPNTLNGSATASGTGIYQLQRGISITLSGSAPSLSIAGSDYTVLNTLGVEGSTTGADLQGINGRLAGNYALGSNIDASASSAWNAGTGFTPIGSLTTPFTGTFDGLGHTITNFTISLTTPNVGLFGATGTGASLLNVGLVGGSVTGAAGTGALVGNNGPNVPISNSYATSSVQGNAGTGGLVGTNTTGVISQSYATGSVNGAAGSGGLVGTNTSGAISGSYATGSVSGAAGTGGLVGSSTSGPISKSYATGSVTGADGTGGLIGSNTSGAISDTTPRATWTGAPARVSAD
jgi:filamentous hemagglutinin family protein